MGRKNPIKLDEVRQALEQIGRGSIPEIANELDKISPKKDKRHWTQEEVENLIKGELWATRDFNCPHEFVFTPNESDREFYKSNRWWNN